MNELVQVVKVIREKYEGSAWNLSGLEVGAEGVCWRFRHFERTARVAPSHSGSD
jgi:hypothetical protein